MKIYDYKEKMLGFIISYFRANTDIVKIVNSLAGRFNSVQNIIEYLANSLSIKNARGQRLDYIGAEVGASRDETDFGNYFCVNKLHLNETVQFYFLSSGQDPKSPLPLSDAEFIQKIYAYIGANASSGNTEEVIAIVKQITNADEVRIINGNNGGIKINICGSGLIITQNTAKYIKQICGSSIYIEEITTND